MKKTLLKKTIFVLLVMIFTKSVFGQSKMFSWDFSDGDIRDILFAVSLDTGISIVADDTVSGKGSFKFAGKDFETAFDSFLKSSRLYVSKESKLWTVSRAAFVEHEGFYDFDVFDLTPGQIVEKISLCCGVTVTYDVLPVALMSMHLKNVSVSELVRSFCLRLPGYEVNERNGSYHLIKKTNALGGSDKYAGEVFKVEKHADGYEIDLKDIRFGQAVEKLFEVEKNAGLKKDFCFLVNSDVKILRTSFFEKSFDDALEKICMQNGFSVLCSDGIYYVVVDSGSKEKLFSEERKWEKFLCNYIKADKALGYLSRRFGKFESVVLPDDVSFVAKVTVSEKKEIEEILQEVDIKSDTYEIPLSFISKNEFVNAVSEYVNKECLVFGEGDSCVYFTGTENDYKKLCLKKEILDKPVNRVSYDLLILQYDENFDNSWNSSFSINPIKSGSRNAVVTQLGSVLNLNFNVVSALGLEFASSLQSSFENNAVQVFADTTLHGVSGKQINFQNTNTYRYRDNNLDPDTGKPVYSGITREIVSGLKLDVIGMISGNGMITSKVTASITRQGTDLSSSTGNPPPTSEKIVTTEVCARSGEPVILSGLIQNAVDEREKGVPLLSKVPLLGWLFKTKESIKQKTQMVIYLVPHIEEYGAVFENDAVNTDQYVLNKCQSILEWLNSQEV